MIGIITHTRRADARWIERCSASVREALPIGSEHVILEMRGDYTRERFDVLHMFPFIGFVDDDDIVRPGAISACMKALCETGAGVAFTSQVLVDEHGHELSVTPPGRFSLDVAMTPQAIHHFALIRTSAVGVEALDAALDAGIGIDWMIKANAALRHGAVHVPMIGYEWRQHEGQDSRERDEQFSKAMPKLRKHTMSWMKGIQRIPVFN